MLGKREHRPCDDAWVESRRSHPAPSWRPAPSRSTGLKLAQVQVPWYLDKSESAILAPTGTGTRCQWYRHTHHTPAGATGIMIALRTMCTGTWRELA